MQTQPIKKVFVHAIKNDGTLKAKLAEANHCAVFTIGKWLRLEDPYLTADHNLAIIKSHFGLLETSELLENKMVVESEPATK